jgi:hypothetical protein
MTLLILFVMAVLILWAIKSLTTNGGTVNPDADYTPGLTDVSATDDGHHHHHSADCSHHGETSHSYDSGSGDPGSSGSSSH